MNRYICIYINTYIHMYHYVKFAKHSLTRTQSSHCFATASWRHGMEWILFTSADFMFRSRIWVAASLSQCNDLVAECI